MSIAVGEQTGMVEHPTICDQAYIDSLPTLDQEGNLEFQRYIYRMIVRMDTNSGSGCK